VTAAALHARMEALPSIGQLRWMPPAMISCSTF
jgi:hypothetical protein